MDDLAQSWKKLSLSKDKDRNMDLTTNKKVGKWVLAAKFLTRRIVNIKAVARTFRPLWRTRREFEVSDAGNNVVLFDFMLKADVEKVLMGEPWSFDRHLVVLERYDGSIPVGELRFDTTSFWVQIHDLPFSYLNVETTLSLGKSLGVVSKPKDKNEMRGRKFMRVGVAMDVTRPLSRGRRVAWDQSSEGWISFKYEHVPNICYWWGHLAHDDKDCMVWLQSKGLLAMEDQQYGAWIRANQHNPSKNVSITVPGFEGLCSGSRIDMRASVLSLVTVVADSMEEGAMAHQRQLVTQEGYKSEGGTNSVKELLPTPVTAKNIFQNQSMP